MSLLSQLRIDIGDFAESGVASSGNLIISHLRVDVGDDGGSGVVVPQVIINQFATPSASGSGVLSNLRLDVGDDGVNVTSSGISQVAGASGTVVMRHLRVDVGDDTNNLPADVRFVYAPATSTDNAIIRFDGITGRYIQDSSVIIQDNGDVSISGSLDVNGTITGAFVIIPSFRLVTSGTTVNLTSTDSTVVINKSTPGPTTVNLPTGVSQGHTIIVKDGLGDAAINFITIVPTATTIDGLASLVIIQNFQSYTLMFDGTKWSVI